MTTMPPLQRWWSGHRDISNVIESESSEEKSHSLLVEKGKIDAFP